MDAISSLLLIFTNVYGGGCRYYIFAGLVFTRLTNFYLRHQFGEHWSNKAPIKLCERYGSSLESEGQEVVLLSKVLSANVNQGFQDLNHIQVRRLLGFYLMSRSVRGTMTMRCTYFRELLEKSMHVVCSRFRTINLNSYMRGLVVH